MHKEEKKAFDINKILELRPDEILIINGLQPVAEEAKKHAEIISKAYTFEIDQYEIDVWHDQSNNNYEHLTHSGVWKVRNSQDSFEISLTANSIFGYYSAEWLIDHNYITKNDLYFLNYEIKKRMASHIRAFVTRTEKLMEATNS